jgi:hypothetical protein
MERVNSDFDDGDNLSKFFGLIKRFNGSRSISIDLKKEIESYFDYRWINDKNQAISTKEEKELLD